MHSPLRIEIGHTPSSLLEDKTREEVTELFAKSGEAPEISIEFLPADEIKDSSEVLYCIYYMTLAEDAMCGPIPVSDIFKACKAAYEEYCAAVDSKVFDCKLFEP